MLTTVTEVFQLVLRYGGGGGGGGWRRRRDYGRLGKRRKRGIGRGKGGRKTSVYRLQSEEEEEGEEGRFGELVTDGRRRGFDEFSTLI